MKMAIISGLMCFSLIVVGQAAIINIPNDYPNIQEGINASVDGDTVLVQPDTYVENINFKGTNIIGFMAPFEVTGNPALIETGFEAGFGEKGSMGFGMVKESIYRR